MALAISDASLTALMRLAEPLAVADRGPFLQDIASALADHHGVVGDGLLYRVAREAQAKLLKPVETRSGRPQPYFNGRKKAQASAG